MAHKWKVKRGQKEHGPLSSEQLRSLARTGKLKPTDLVRRGEIGEWKEASSVAGLLSQGNEARKTATAGPVSEPAANSSPSESLGFIEWYKTKWMAQQPAVAQAALWLFYGWLWIPTWYLTTARTGNIFVKVAVGAILVALLLPAIKNAREAARRAQERAVATGTVDTKTVSSSGNKSGKWGLIGTDGKLIEPCIHEYDHSAYYDLNLDTEGRKWSSAFVDMSKKYSELGAGLKAHDPKTGISLVQAINGEWSFIDGNDHVIARLPKQYHFFDRSFDENGYTRFLMTGGVWGMSDINGRIVIEPRFSSLSPFFEGMAAAQRDVLSTFDPTLPAGKSGYVDMNGQWVIKPQWRDTRPFSEGLAAVQDAKTKKWGFIDQQGRLIIDFKFDDVHTFDYTRTTAGAFADGLAAVRVGDKWGYIDKKGQFVVPPIYQKAYRFDSGYAAVQW